MDNEVGNTFGFELLFNIFQPQVSKKEDVLVLFTHWFLLKNGFKCLGIGDSKMITPDDKFSEILPNSWNQSLNYSLRYVKHGYLYILIGVPSQSFLLLNLMRVNDNQVFTVQFEADVVQNIEGSLESLIPDHLSIIKMLHHNFIVRTESEDRQEISTQTENSRSRRNQDPLQAWLDIDALERNDFWRYSTF